MTRLLQFAAGLAFAAVATLPASVHAADPTDVIEYRKHVMKSFGSQAAALNAVLQGKAPAENLVSHTETLALLATTALIAFEPNVEGGDAKPEVWAKWEDFSKKMNEFAANTADLANVAKAGGIPAVQAKMQTAMTCKGCHDTYRVPKK
jgi:cytochrome c556